MLNGISVQFRNMINNKNIIRFKNRNLSIQVFRNIFIDFRKFYSYREILSNVGIMNIVEYADPGGRSSSVYFPEIDRMLCVTFSGNINISC